MAPSPSVARDNDKLFCLVETVDHVIDKCRAYEWMVHEMNQYPINFFSGLFCCETTDSDDQRGELALRVIPIDHKGYREAGDPFLYFLGLMTKDNDNPVYLSPL